MVGAVMEAVVRGKMIASGKSDGNGGGSVVGCYYVLGNKRYILLVTNMYGFLSLLY